MKTRSLSVIVGTYACNADCPFCISRMTGYPPRTRLINADEFKRCCKILPWAADGLPTVILTGKGEPTLYPSQIDEYLGLMDGRFPCVELHTNGIRFGLEPDWAHKMLRRWRASGLTAVSISIAHFDAFESDRWMGITQPYDFWDAVEICHKEDLPVRLRCVLIKGAVDDGSSVDSLVSACESAGVEQLTLLEITTSHAGQDPKVVEWVRENKPLGATQIIARHLMANGARRLLWLPHGAIVYDYRGQNVCVSNCLTPPEADNLRQIIFYPDGRIMYDWQSPAARII